MLPLNRADEDEQSSWQREWLLSLHGWADLVLTLVSVCSDMSVFRSAAAGGGDRLV